MLANSFEFNAQDWGWSYGHSEEPTYTSLVYRRDRLHSEWCMAQKKSSTMKTS